MVLYPAPPQPQSTGWKRWVLIGMAILERLFANRQLFREVSSVSLRSFNIKSDVEGTTAEIAGQLNYADGSTEAFSAQLQKENDQWRLIRINFR